VSIDGARNAGILAARIIGAFDPKVATALEAFSVSLADQVAVKNKNLKSQI
jgi:5-(carboxyamino)imidazole ribonucleotide mutase